MLLLLFAFLAGIATVLSPCILPILPALLAGSISAGRWRPFGMIVGLILSFTLFTLSLTALVQATGISPNLLRYFAISLLVIFGLILLFPKLSDLFARATAPITSLGLKVQGSSKSGGFFSGVLFGSVLGLLWTPCAGPILASITTLVATHEIDSFTVLMTLAYSIGAGIPLFLIAYGGSKLLHLSKHTEIIRQIFGGLTILTALAIALHWDILFQTKIADLFPLIEGQKVEMGDFGPAPELTGITEWINTPPLTLEQLKGKVVLIDFWTYSCINCLRTLPYLEKWDAHYKDLGFVLIGVHTPEFEFEKDTLNVEEAAKRLGIHYPIAQDNEYKTWKAFNNRYWPAHYLIDQKGILRMVHFGEGAYVETENAIRELLGLIPMKMHEEEKVTRTLSPETYLGFARGNRYQVELKPKESFFYDYSTSLREDQVGLKGLWQVESESITSLSDASYLDYNFLAKQVYLVLSGSSDVPLEVFLDGKPYGKISIQEDRKYDIVNTDYGRHQLSLKIPQGIKAYAFTFGDD